MKATVLAPLNAEPPVSIMLANYNYERYLPEAIQSVLNQTYTNWELVICDDGSTDGSLKIALEFGCRDPRIVVLNKDNGGQVSAWNYAYQHCRGDIIAFLDSDDAFFSHKLETVVRQFKENPAAGLVYHYFQYADEDLKPLDRYGPDELPTGWLAKRSLQNGGQAFVSKTSDLAVRREILELLFPLPDALKIADDYICRCAVFLTEIAAISEVLSYYRVHGQNVMGSVTSLHLQTLKPLIRLLHSTFRHHRDFLLAQFGPGVAEQLRVEDLEFLWTRMASLYILKGKPKKGIEGYSPEAILEGLPQNGQKRLWKLLFLLPAFFSQRLLRLWWADAGWKRVARPIASSLGLRQEPGAET
jgi:glycosyltransferase involved in cell wall biosynthesis